jgi:hypothetical protein
MFSNCGSHKSQSLTVLGKLPYLATFYEANVAEWYISHGTKCTDQERCCYLTGRSFVVTVENE